jgi:hypothetical protein
VYTFNTNFLHVSTFIIFGLLEIETLQLSLIFSCFNNTRKYLAVRFVVFPKFWILCIPTNQIKFSFMRTRGLYVIDFVTGFILRCY